MVAMLARAPCSSFCLLGSVTGQFFGPRLLEQGRLQLRKVQEMARQPGYGRCWSEALSKVDRRCRQLDQEEQSRIALAFTHCHLQRSGKSFPACTETSSIRVCTQDMDALAFGAYTEFFTHAHSICYYLQNELWQQQVDDTVTRLTVNSESVARQLEATNRMAEEMIAAQNVTLSTQAEILRNGGALKQVLQQSTDGVRQVFRELQDSTREQRQVFAEIFDRLSYLHQFVMVESTVFTSILYNLLALAVAFLLTSTQRTAAARLLLFMLITFSVYLERTVYSSEMEPSESSFEYRERIYCRIWLLRKLVAFAGVLVLAYSITSYQDVGRQSLELLRSLRESQSSLRQVIEEAEKIMKAPLLSDSRSQGQDGRLKDVELDSGIGDTRIVGEESLTSGGALQPEDFAAYPTSTPKKTGAPPRSPSRSAVKKHKARRSDVSVYNILVSDSPSKYNLRSRTPSGRPPAILG
ncbi:uncharacterized protein [Heterodontus francisci]|uniref:uncharacterized protein n=1 Tax=Heterodontus francisci TaxID=7792 RepID=UPI00355B1086